MSVADPPPSAPPLFTWGAFIGGLLAALLVGCALNIFAGVLGMATDRKIAAFFVTALPGLAFAALGWFLRRKSPSFGSGLICGGCVAALIGGICGASMIGTAL